MSPIFAALPPADLPTVAYQPTALHTAEILVAKDKTSHTVRSGETLYDIAARYDVSVQSIIRANGLKDGGRWIMPGQTLRLSGNGAAPVPAPSSSSSSSSKASSSGGTITVRSGDTLYGLASRHGVSMSALARANSISSGSFIYPGQKLRLPGSSTSAPAKAPAPSKSSSSSSKASSSGGTITVRSGDTLYGLASRHGVSMSALARANNISSGSFIYPGQKLRLPGTGTSSSSSAGAAKVPAPNGPYDETNIGSYKKGEKVPDTFLHYRYSDGVARSAAANREYLANADVPTRDEMKKLIVAAANKHGVDAKLMLALSYQESGWNHRAVSPANAIGAMQVIPSSGQWASGLAGRPLNLLDPKDNAEAGVVIIKALLASASSKDHAIGGYYQGLGSVRQHGLFDDTKQYVKNIKYFASTL